MKNTIIIIATLFILFLGSACEKHSIPLLPGAATPSEVMKLNARGYHFLKFFPANINGVYEFGSLAEPRIILQKGHNIKVPEKKLPQKYIAEFISVTGTKKPRFGAFRQEIDEDEEE